MRAKPRFFGVAAEFDEVENLVAATRKAREAGYKRMDTYTPFPVHELSEAAGFRDEKVPIIMFVGAVIGAFTGFFLQTFTNAFDYPVNVGGRPLIGYPAWVPVTFECTILFSALSGAIGMIMLNGLPKPYDPMFNLEGFERASQDRFFICIEAKDPNFDLDETTRFLEGLGAVRVQAVTE